MLALRSVTKRFGGVVAVDDVNLDLEKGGLLGIIGPNGAGKTTLLNIINGLYRPDSGKIYFNGREITHLRPYRIARIGIGRTYQVPRVLKNMTVEENILLPASLSANHDDVTHKLEEVLKLTRLEELRNYFAGELSGGQQKLLEMARQLIHYPSLLLLDEPFSGVHPELKQTLIEVIKGVNAQGTALIFVSHDMSTVSALCPRVIAMDSGRFIADGPFEEVSTSPQVLEAYLGAGHTGS